MVVASAAGLVLLLGIGSYSVASAANRGPEHRSGHGHGHGHGQSTPAGSSTASPTASSTPKTSATATPSKSTSTTKPAGTTSTTSATTAPATVTSTKAAAGSVSLPPANGQFDYQIGGAYTPASAVAIVDRDHSAKAASGKYNICYINSFQSQPGESSTWSGLLLKNKSGGNFEDPDWPGEYFLNTSTAANRTAIAAIEGKWIDACAAAGFKAIEPDNLDTYDRSNGLLTKANNVAMAKLLADKAHAAGLAIAQKNTAGLTKSDATSAGFDFAIAEECQEYGECNAYTSIYGNQVYEIEYTDNKASDFTNACAAQGKTISVILRDRDVVPAGDKAYHYQAC